MVKLSAAKVGYCKTRVLSLARDLPCYKVLCYCKFTCGLTGVLDLAKCGLKIPFCRSPLYLRLKMPQNRTSSIYTLCK